MEPFIGEIRMFAFGQERPLTNMLPCDGRTLPVQPYQPLYSLLGNFYGGVPNQTFNLPDLRGAAIIGDFTSGQQGGAAGVTLTSAQMPQHSHVMYGSTNSPNVTNGDKALLAQGSVYAPSDANLTALSPGSISAVGANQCHENRQPCLAVSFLICVGGPNYPMAAQAGPEAGDDNG